MGEEILSAIRKESAKSFKFDKVYGLNIDEVSLYIIIFIIIMLLLLLLLLYVTK